MMVEVGRSELEIGRCKRAKVNMTRVIASKLACDK